MGKGIKNSDIFIMENRLILSHVFTNKLFNKGTIHIRCSGEYWKSLKFPTHLEPIKLKVIQRKISTCIK